MRIRRRTAAALCALFLLASAGAAVWRLLQPERLRSLVLDGIRRELRPGYDVELDGVDYDIRAGRLRCDGLRLLRTTPRREVLASIPRVEVSTRIWQLFTNLAVTDVRLFDPDVTVERDPDGGFVLAGAFGPWDDPAPSFRPRIRVSGGTVRYRDGSLLAPGGDLRFAVKEVDWQESKDGGPSEFEAELRETAAGGGAASLGKVTLRGKLPLAPSGLVLAVERFTFDGALLARLAPDLRERFAGVHIEGPFGEGREAPGLEVLAAAAAGGPAVTARLRPRGVSLLLDALPVRFTGGTGTLAYDGASRGLQIEDFAIRYKAAEIHLDGRLEGLGSTFTGGMKFWARGLDLDGELHDALPPEVRRVWDAYGLCGVVDVTGAEPGEAGSFDSRFERAAADAPLRVGVTVRLRGGAMSYHGYVDPGDGVRKGFAWPVEHLGGSVRVDWIEGGATVVDLRDLEGRHGDVPVKAHGFVRDFGAGASGESRAEVGIHVEARGLALDDDVRRASPGMEDLFRRFSPSGRASLVKVFVEQILDVDDTAHESVSIDFDGDASFRYVELPLLLEGVSGHVDYRNERTEAGRVPAVALQGIRGRPEGGGELSIDGTVEGDDAPRLGLFVSGRGIPLDGPLETALRAAPGAKAAADVWDRARPSGTGDFRAGITGRDRAGERREEIQVDLNGVSIAGWGDIRYPVSGLHGTVEVLPESVTLRGLRGTGAEGPVTLEGVVRDPGGEATLDLVIGAEDALLDESLRGPLGPAAAKAEGYFDIVRPAPGLRGDVKVMLQGSAESVEPVLEASGIRGGIRPLDVRNLDVAEGAARYEDGRVIVTGLAGAIGDREFTVREARFDLERGTGRMDLEVRRLRFPRDLLGILSEEAVTGIERVTPDRFFHVDRLDVHLSDGFRRIALDGVVSLSPTRPGRNDGLGLQGIFDLDGLAFQRKGTERPWTEITGAVHLEGGELRPGIDLEHLRGRIDFGGTFGPDGNRAVLSLSDFSGQAEGRTLEGASGIVEVNPDGTLLRELRGRLARGEIGGHFLVRPPGSGFKGRFTLSGAHARDVFTPDDPTASVEGRVSGDIEIGNPTGRPEDLRGQVRADVTGGSLFRVPVFDRIYSLLGQSRPPEFTAGMFAGGISGDRLRLEEFDVDSSVLSLHKAAGGSFVWLDGRIDLKLRPEFKGVTTWPGLSWLFDAFNVVVKPVYERFHTIRVTGTLRNPVVDQDFLPFLSSGPEDRLPRLPVPPEETNTRARPVWDF